MKMKVFTADRRRVDLDVSSEQQVKDIAEIGHLVKANDGVWVPKCDLTLYEAGRRVAFNVSH